MPTLEQAKPRARRPTSARRAVLKEYLVRETLDGQALYYAGYQTVLAGRKTVEEIRGSSSLQCVLVGYFMEFMILHLDRKKYWFALMAERRAAAWLTMAWHRDLELLDGQLFNAGQYLADEGIRAGS